MKLIVRKIVTHRETTLLEFGEELLQPHLVAWTAAVIANPYPEGFVPEVVATADELSEPIGALLGPRCVELLGADVEAFGKAALVGAAGELEHGSALIHNLKFGNRFRDAAGGSELLPAAEKVGLMGATIDVPVKHKTDSKTRSHHQTITLSIPGAPLPREILIACVAVSAGRPLARLAEFGAEVAHV